MSKQDAYRANHWQAPVPWVHFQWSEQDWINHIDINGRWTVPVED